MLRARRQHRPRCISLAQWRQQYEPEYLYVFSTLGQKIKWMRQNPKVCLQADEVENRSAWTSVVVNGTYLELREPQYATEKKTCARTPRQVFRVVEYASGGAARRHSRSGDRAVFFRIDIESMSGLRGIP
jgi:hypothetical protein